MHLALPLDQVRVYMPSLVVNERDKVPVALSRLRLEWALHIAVDTYKSMWCTSGALIGELDAMALAQFARCTYGLCG